MSTPFHVASALRQPGPHLMRDVDWDEARQDDQRVQYARRLLRSVGITPIGKLRDDDILAAYARLREREEAA